ncbi:MAG: TetR family transcriptional regulator, partial [Flavobacteriales bacterium]|nr:TetR family transcriptional regulator [Flavobacteriales bacterium]
MKRKIIDIAIIEFSNYGFKSVTVDDIALKMGVSKKTIYAHFPKKETLVETSVMKHFEIVIEKILFISKHSKDPIIELYQMNK